MLPMSTHPCACVLGVTDCAERAFSGLHVRALLDEAEQAFLTALIDKEPWQVYRPGPGTPKLVQEYPGNKFRPRPACHPSSKRLPIDFTTTG